MNTPFSYSNIIWIISNVVWLQVHVRMRRWFVENLPSPGQCCFSEREHKVRRSSVFCIRMNGYVYLWTQFISKPICPFFPYSHLWPLRWRPTSVLLFLRSEVVNFGIFVASIHLIQTWIWLNKKLIGQIYHWAWQSLPIQLLATTNISLTSQCPLSDLRHTPLFPFPYSNRAGTIWKNV